MTAKMSLDQLVNYLNAGRKAAEKVIAVNETVTPFVESATPETPSTPATPAPPPQVEELVEPEKVATPFDDDYEEDEEVSFVVKDDKKKKITLTPAQQQAANTFIEWLKTPGYGKLELAGYAGVGKTTFLNEALALATQREKGSKRPLLYPSQIWLAAPTGTASLVMIEKTPGYSGSTYHKLFYMPSKDENHRLVFVPSPEKLNGIKLVIMDESSMVGKKNALEIIEMCKKAGCKLFVVGDPGQLSPVGKDNESFFFVNPDITLTEVLRQAAGNPIVSLSMAIRQATENGVPYMVERRQQIIDNKVFILPRTRVGVEQYAKVIRNGGVIIAGTNKTRRGLNLGIRNQLGFTDMTLMEGETVLMKDNLDDGLGIPVTNGMRGKVTNIRHLDNGIIKFTFSPEKFPGSRDLEVHEDVLFERKTIAKLRYERFLHFQQTGEELKSGSEVFFGYCITGHASQGSQWDTVYVIDESHVFSRDAKGYIEKNRWLYTVVTRAAENLVICY